jgi:glycosyltransferase involved in cell wall biosynthesis
MPAVFEHASCFVLGSLPTPMWEEQFGMVLAEAGAAGLPIVAAQSGAIPEVLRGNGTLFAPGDWEGLAAALAPIVSEPPQRVRYDELYSVEAAADRYAAAYARVLNSR